MPGGLIRPRREGDKVLMVFFIVWRHASCDGDQVSFIGLGGMRGKVSEAIHMADEFVV
jgi:hypothetical protein